MLTWFRIIALIITIPLFAYAEEATPTPSPTSLVRTAPRISAGESHTCAIRKGTVYCWGTSNYGEVGPLTDTGLLGVPRTTKPIKVLEGASAVAVGRFHSCALASGRAKCWGWNKYGQLGVKPSEGEIFTTPREITDQKGNVLTDVEEIAVGDTHTCILRNKTVYCIGRSMFGELGSKKVPWTYFPKEVRLPQKVLSLTSGAHHLCALTERGSAFCWGRNEHGQCGTGDLGAARPPALVQNLSGATAIVAGGDHTCAILPNTSALCWGDNTDYELGNSSFKQNQRVMQPVSVTNEIGLTLTGVTALSLGKRSTCALIDEKTYCWGWLQSNQESEPGVSSVTGIAPVLVEGYPLGMSSLSSGAEHTCGMDANERVFCHGINSAGQTHPTRSDSAFVKAVQILEME